MEDKAQALNYATVINSNNNHPTDDAYDMTVTCHNYINMY